MSHHTRNALLRRSLPQSSAPQISVSRSIGPWSLLFDRRLGRNIARTGETALLALFIIRAVNGRPCFVIGRFAPTAVARELIRFSVFPYQSRTGELLYESLSLGGRTALQVRFERSKDRSLTVARRSFFAAAPALDALIGTPLLHATYNNDDRWHHRGYHRGGHGIGNLSSLR